MTKTQTFVSPQKVSIFIRCRSSLSHRCGAFATETGLTVASQSPARTWIPAPFAPVEAAARLLLNSRGMAWHISSWALAVGIVSSTFLTLPSTAFADPSAAELRFQFFAPSVRWTEGRRDRRFDYDSELQSLYFAPGVGGRYFPRGGAHGALIDFEYRFDSRVDDPWLFCDGPCDDFDVDFGAVHVGYAYRHIVLSPRRPRRRFWAFTPHVSFATGWVKTAGVIRRFPDLGALVGGRVGFDIDLHFDRFFFGWSLRYEADYVTRGSAEWSHFFSWNAIPMFRFGFDLGPRQSRYDTSGYP